MGRQSWPLLGCPRKLAKLTKPFFILDRFGYVFQLDDDLDTKLNETEIKKLMLCKIHFSPVGVLTLQQAGLLEPGDGRDADRKGYFRYKGPLFHTLLGTTDHGEEMEYYWDHQDWPMVQWLCDSYYSELPTVEPNPNTERWQAKAFQFIAAYRTRDYQHCQRLLSWWHRDPNFGRVYSNVEARVLTYAEDPELPARYNQRQKQCSIEETG